MILLVIFWTNFYKNPRDICCTGLNFLKKIKQCFHRQDLENDYKTYEMRDLSIR